MLCLASLTSCAATTEAMFGSWKKAYGKTYASAQQEKKAFAAFSENEGKIAEHNRKGLSWTLGHNTFSDLTSEEFFAKRLGFKRATNKTSKPTYDIGLKDPINKTSVDWVRAGKVTKVKDQGDCGSCWAFSTIGGIESAFAIDSGKLVSLSEQELVSCDSDSRCKECGCMGCQGGNMDYAVEYAMKNPICAESAFEYVSGTGLVPKCASKCKGFVEVGRNNDVPKGDEAALLKAVSSRPVIVAIEADKQVFHLYKSGVVDSPTCGDDLDHGVLVVGFGTDEGLGKDYWTIKNSWGADWGERGFVRLVRGKDMCGVADDANYPTNVTAVAPIPPPAPPTPAPPLTHYSNPAVGLGCLQGEDKMQVDGIPGDWCSPECAFGSDPKECPRDLPTTTGPGVTVECLLGGATNRNCVMGCDSHATPDPCPKGASCKNGGSVDICTYDTNATNAVA